MKKLKIFETHGVVFTDERGVEQIGTCPFTGKENKFYVNTESWLWDSKTAGLSGNITKFLDLISLQNIESITTPIMRKLSEHRGLPKSAFTSWNVGWDGLQYTIPVRDHAGFVQDIRRYRLTKSSMLSTSGCLSGLLGAHRMPKRLSDPIYICEGEWDAVALRWLLQKLREPGVVVAVPGASSFKQEWVPWFNNRIVHTLFDSDEAGENGELLVQKRLYSTAKRITYIAWPSNVPTGFDIRDWIIYGAIKKRDPDGCWASLQTLFQPRPRKSIGGGKNISTESHETFDDDEVRPTEWKKPPSLDQTLDVYRRWLYLKDTDPLLALFASHLSQLISGPPIWLFLVAPPGGAKTEMVTALSLLDQTYMTSSLTPHALISGASTKGTEDPSLIPRLNGRVMVIKDFTAILAMRDPEKDEIFGILRDAYDGRCGKVFGNGIERSYKSRFTIIAAVTPRIYDLSSQHTSLGERFLKLSGGDNLVHSNEQDIISRAIDNIARESDMKWELSDVTRAFIERRMKWIGKLDLTRYPELPATIKTKIIYLGMFGARMRGSVSRDTYRNDIMTSRPSAEVGSRLGIQLAKMVKSLALVRGRRICSDEDYRIVKRIVLDTIPQRTEDMVRTLVLKCPKRDMSFSIQDIAKATKYPTATVQRIIQDLFVLDIVERIGSDGGYKHEWKLSRYIRRCIKRANLYSSDTERSRATRLWIKTRKLRKKENA